MARKKDTELTKIIHVRIAEGTDNALEQHGRQLNCSKADVIRLALNMFVRRGGVDYAKDDD